MLLPSAEVAGFTDRRARRRIARWPRRIPESDERTHRLAQDFAECPITAADVRESDRLHALISRDPDTPRTAEINAIQKRDNTANRRVFEAVEHTTGDRRCTQ